jgi:hypothetical protein
MEPRRRYEMICGNTLRARLFLALALVMAIVVAGCAAKKALWGDPESGIILTYRMAVDQALRYESSSEFVQNLDISGQTMETTSSRKLSFSVAPKGMTAGNQRLGVTIDAMTVAIQSPQGDLNPDMGDVIGKSFDMTLSPLGKEGGLSGAKAIKYIVGLGGERTLKSEFDALFPDLAGVPVKVGGSWTTRDTINVEEGNSKIQITFKNDNTLVGYETVNGMECAKMTAVVTGKLTGEGEQGGAALIFEGDVTGEDTWYFAYKEGVFVKTSSTGTIKGTITAGGPQGMVIPMTQTTKLETALVM